MSFSKLLKNKYSYSSVVLGIWMVMILVVQPFYCTNGYARLGTDKAMFFRYVTIICLVTYFIIRLPELYKSNEHEYKICKIDTYVLMFLAAHMLSFFLSKYKDVAVWGENGWFVGFVPHLLGMLIYFAISFADDLPLKVLYAAFPASAVVFIIGIFNYFGINIQGYDALYVDRVSTIGNINWYCGYLVMLLGAAVALWEFDKSKILLGYIILTLIAFVFQGSQSGYLSIIAIVIYLVYKKLAKRNGRLFIAVLMMLASAYVIILMINTSAGGALTQALGIGDKVDEYLLFSDVWASGRGGTFTSAFMIFEECSYTQRLFGVGPDCFYTFCERAGSADLWVYLQANFGNDRLTNAHNELLSMVINEGIVGAIFFANMLFGGIIKSLRSVSGNRRLTFCAGLVLLAYVTNNMVSFEQSMTLPLLYLALGLASFGIKRETLYE